MTETNLQITSASVSDRGLSEKRPQNEDSYLEMPYLGLFAVADGVGGAQAGDVASQMAMEILSEAFTNLRAGGDAEEMMKLAIERANEAIYQMSSDLPQLSTMATTIVALHLNGNIATIGHVGDSRLYRVDSAGNLYRETQDHSLVEEEVRAGRMTPAQAETHPSRNVISRALGAEATVEIDMKTIMVDPGTTFLLCSDGITRHISDFEIRELIGSRTHPADICGTMKNLCYDRGAEDNLTAVIVRCAGIPKELAELLTAEDDEATVATARAASASGYDAGYDEDDAPTRGLVPPADMVEEGEAYSYSYDEQQPAADETAPGHEQTLSFRAHEPEETPAASAADDQEFMIYGDEEKSGGGFGRVLSYLALLIVGAALGAGGYYFYLQQNPPAAQVQQAPITEMKTPNIPYTSFEDSRRTVDADPEAFIARMKDKAEGSEDLYLLGRAYLLTGKQAEAKLALTAARDKLADSKPENPKMMASEIGMALAIANNTFAAKEMQTLVNAMKTAPAATPGNK